MGEFYIYYGGTRAENLIVSATSNASYALKTAGDYCTGDFYIYATDVESFALTYDGNTILSGTGTMSRKLSTAGTFCTGDISVSVTMPTEYVWDVYDIDLSLDTESESPWTLTLPEVMGLQLANMDYSADGIVFEVPMMYRYMGKIGIRSGEPTWTIPGSSIEFHLSDDCPDGIYVLNGDVLDPMAPLYELLCLVTQCTEIGDHTYELSGTSWSAKGERGTATGTTVTSRNQSDYPANGIGFDVATGNPYWYVLRS